METMRVMTMVIGGALAGAIACASGESSSDTAAGAGSRTPAVVASSPPLPGFGPADPAGVLPGTSRAPVGPAPPPGPAATPGAGTTSANASTSGTGAASSGTVSAGGSGGSGGTGTGTGSGAGRTGGTPTTSGAGQPGSALTLAAGEVSAATGVFTAVQADRGKEVYTNSCARCHMASQHSGGAFASTWNTRRVSDLFEVLHSTMPLDAPGSLTDQQYADVVAYMLQLNGHPAGKTALAADPAVLRRIRIDIRPSS